MARGSIGGGLGGSRSRGNRGGGPSGGRSFDRDRDRGIAASRDRAVSRAVDRDDRGGRETFSPVKSPTRTPVAQQEAVYDAGTPGFLERTMRDITTFDLAKLIAPASVLSIGDWLRNQAGPPTPESMAAMRAMDTRNDLQGGPQDFARSLAGVAAHPIGRSPSSPMTMPASGPNPIAQLIASGGWPSSPMPQMQEQLPLAQMMSQSYGGQGIG